eukprot:tig00000204_g17728.t1
MRDGADGRGAPGDLTRTVVGELFVTVDVVGARGGPGVWATDPEELEGAGPAQGPGPGDAPVLPEPDGAGEPQRAGVACTFR